MASRIISAVLTLQDRDFSSNLRRASERTDDLGRGVTFVGNKIQKFGESAAQAFRQVSASVAKVSLAGLSAGVGAISAGVAHSILEMDESFGILAAKTGAYGNELKGLETTAKDVFRAGFGESLTQVSSDVATLSSMFDDLNSEQLTEVAMGAATIGKAWDLEMKEVGKAVSIMTKTFDDLSTSQALDLITVAFQETGDQADDLIDTFSEYSTQFKALGYDAEGFTATLIAGAKAGVFNFDKLADSAKESFLLLSEGSDDVKDALGALGLDANKITSDIAQGGDKAQQAFIAVSSALGTVESASKRSEIALALFGTPLEDLGPQFQTFFSEVNQDLGNFEGATSRAADTLQNSFGTRAVKAWRDLKLGIAEVVTDGSGKEFLDNLATSAENLVPKIQEIVEKAFEFGNTIRDNWGPIKETVIGITTAVGTFALAMGALKIISGVTTLIQGFRAALAAGSVAQWALNFAMLASPTTWLAAGIAAVVAAGVLLYRNWDIVKEKAGQLWKKLQDNPLLGLAAGPFGVLASAAATLYKNFDKIKENFQKFKNAISNFKLPSWVSSIGSTLSSAASKVGNLINGSHATGLNRVPFDGYIAELHKDEMVIPARQAERLRQQGANINNVDIVSRQQKVAPIQTASTTNNNQNNARNNVTVNIYPTGTTASQVINEIVPQLKLALANM